MTPLETTIARMTGQSLAPPAMPYYQQPHQVKTYRVCPHCQRIPLFFVNSQQWECLKCGAVTPIKSAVVNEWPYRAERNAA